jgi:hypothetical protein
MSNFQRLLNKHKVNYGDFNVWSDKAEREGNWRKRLFEAYERSLRRCEIFESDLQTWMMRHQDDKDFKVRLKAKGQRLAELERLSVAKLERIFAQYRRDVRKKR